MVGGLGPLLVVFPLCWEPSLGLACTPSRSNVPSSRRSSPRPARADSLARAFSHRGRPPGRACHRGLQASGAGADVLLRQLREEDVRCRVSAVRGRAHGGPGTPRTEGTAGDTCRFSIWDKMSLIGLESSTACFDALPWVRVNRPVFNKPPFSDERVLI